LAYNGLTVLATDVNEDGLAETASMASNVDTPGPLETLVADLQAPADIEGIVAEADELGTVRYVANIAGVQHVDAISEFPLERYQLIQDVMLRAPFLLAKHVFPLIAETEDGVGAIGNMCSVHGHYVSDGKAAYNVAKFGLRGLTKSIAAEGGGSLRSFSVSAHHVKTPLVVDELQATAAEHGKTEQEVLSTLLSEARTDQSIEPYEIANLFVFGFSDHATHLNGGDLLWDGGFTSTYERPSID
jgi:3-hydroxybutyrate dehydrogenase